MIDTLTEWRRNPNIKLKIVTISQGNRAKERKE